MFRLVPIFSEQQLVSVVNQNQKFFDSYKEHDSKKENDENNASLQILRFHARDLLLLLNEGRPQVLVAQQVHVQGRRVPLSVQIR